jgi:TolB-like protein/Flp pilus assembly protein TadD
MSLSPGTRLGSYEIVSPLGAGGMGEVYRARDARLGRDVAVKVLPEDFLEGEEPKARFEREAKLLAALNHPNIAAIHAFEEIPGSPSSAPRHLLVMEFLEGMTLRDRLDSGPIAPRQVVDYALQIAKGLSAAHEKGIVHRDLKPENLFLTKDGHLKILDFGLAKRTEQDRTGDETSAPTESKHTEPGVVMGTVAYMSPEQVRGLPVDHRSDIFSFGAILYELLSGKKAFKRDTPADTMSAILKEEPPELSESGRNISSALDHVVKHCLEKDRANRFQSAKDIAFALSEASGEATSRAAQAAAPASGKTKVLVAVAVIVVLAVAGIFFLRRSQKVATEAGGVRRVAVLPFENLGAPEDDYFADGIADAVRGKLTSLPGVEVIARGSSTPYRKTTKSQREVAHELDARYLLTATVRWQKSGGASRVQVSPELVEVKESGAPASRWQQPFDAALTDVFQMQSDIATRVAQALGVALGAGEAKQLAEKPTQNLAAYDAFLKAEEASKGMGVDDPRGLRKALGFYEQAVALDPGFALAWAQISRSGSNLYFLSTPTPELAEHAREAAEKSVALAPNRPEGYLALGDYQKFVLGDPTRALDLYATGQRLAPGNADLLAATAMSEEILGRWEASVEHFHQAERLDPRSVLTQDQLGEALVFLRRYAEARGTIDRGLALAPTHIYLIELKAMTFLVHGDLAGARAVIKAVPKEVEPTALVAWLAYWFDLVWVLDEPQRELLLRLTPSAFDDDRGTWSLCLVQAYALKGEAANVRKYAEEARKAFEEQLHATPKDPQRHCLLGVALAYLGRKEEAIREAERGVTLLPVTKNAYLGAYLQHALARTYILVGEQEKAIDQLELLLRIPYVLSPGWLRIDPNFDPLRKNPRFQKLIAGK